MMIALGSDGVSLEDEAFYSINPLRYSSLVVDLS